MRPTKKICAPAILASLTIVAPASTALGQDALGDGRALDANLNTTSGGINSVGGYDAFRAEVDFRNAVVTGNVGGGRAFRGELGYTAADDFRGELGANVNFEFYRDSYSAGLATQNLSGIDALRSSLSWSVAGQTQTGLGGRIIVDRAGVGATAANVYGQPHSGGNIRLDPLGAVAGTIRSPSRFVLRNADRPDVLGATVTETESGERRQELITASTLLGVKPLPPTSELFGIRTDEPPIPPVEPTTPSDDEEQALGAENRIRPEPAERSPTHERILTSISESLRIDARATTTSTEPSTEPATRPAETTPQAVRSQTEEEVERRLEELRRRLDLPEDPAPSEQDAGDPEEADDRERTVSEMADELLNQVVPEVSTLDPSLVSSRLYQEHMRRGAELLRTERWFVAEERFTAALTVKPGDAIAAAGRVHAQLGAGMYLSAAVNLRNLLRGYPEFIPVRYDASLLPAEERRERIVAQLRQRMERDTNVGYDAALLLAYVGHQIGDEALVDEGFETTGRIEAALDLRADPLLDALRAVWLSDDE